MSAIFCNKYSIFSAQWLPVTVKLQSWLWYNRNINSEKHKQQHHIHISSDSLMVQSIELNGFNGNKVIFGEMWASLWFELLSMSCHSSFMMLSIGKYDDKTQPQVHLYSRQRYFMSYESLSYNWPSSNTQLECVLGWEYCSIQSTLLNELKLI